MEAIVLVGGLGTRLRSVVSDVPKPMACINDIPFLEYILNYLNKHQVKKIILCTGYKGNIVREYFGYIYKGSEIVYSNEDTPLGTGGAIKKALSKCKNEKVFVLNGDTYFDINLSHMKDIYSKNKCDIAIGIKHMTNFDRYGSVVLENNKVSRFEEKKFVESGFINGGVYYIDRNLFHKYPCEEDKFSFEQEFIEKNINNLNIEAYISNNYFIDIGIPEDYKKAQNELRNII